MRRNKLAVFAFLLCVSVMSDAQRWVWSRDDNSLPIDREKDQLSITLLESRVKSGNTFLAKDKMVGLMIETTLSGASKSEGNDTSQRTFPFVFESAARQSPDKKSVVLTKQKHILLDLPLKEANTEYHGLEIGLTLLRRQDPKVWVKVFQTMLEKASGVALPLSPFSKGFGYVTDFAKTVLHDNLPNPDDQKRIDLGTLAVSLRSDQGTNRITNTGVYLWVDAAQSVAPEGTVVVDPDLWNNYCWQTKFVGTNWAVYVAPKKPSGTTGVDSSGCLAADYKQLGNNFVPFLLTTSQQKGISALSLGAARERAESLRLAGLAQCKLVGLRRSDCPARTESKE